MSTVSFLHTLVSVSAGTGLYWAYCHRCETHMLGLVYLTTFLAASAAELLTLVNLHGVNFGPAVVLTVKVALALSRDAYRS